MYLILVCKNRHYFQNIQINLELFCIYWIIFVSLPQLLGTITKNEQDMKTFRFISLALSAIISVSLCACGDDDSNSPETPVGPSPQAKHITRIVQDEDDGDRTEYIFSYDSQGRVTSMVEKETDRTRAGSIYTYSFDFTYGDNTVTIKRDDSYNYTYSLLNGRITSCKREYLKSSSSEDRITSYSYDAQGYLASMNENSENRTFTWSGGDLTESDMTYQEHDGERHRWYRLDYSDDTAPANYIPIILFDSKEAVLAMMGLFGKMPVHLVRNITTYKNGTSDYISTTLVHRMQDGLPVSIDYTEVHLSNDNPETPTFAKITLEWN